MKRKLFLVYLCSLAMPLNGIASVILAYVYQTFPDANASLVAMMYTLPTLVAAIMNMFAGALTEKIDSKILFIIGMGAGSVGGCVIVFTQGSVLMLDLIAVGLLGFTYGLVNVTIVNYLNRSLEPDKRARFVGYNTSVSALASAGFFMIAGVLAASGEWYRAYYLCIVQIIALIAVIFLMPSLKPGESAAEGAAQKAAASGSEEKAVPTMPEAPKNGMVLYVFLTIFYALAYMLLSSWLLNYSEYLITELQLGSSVEIGVSGTISALTAMVAGLVVGIIAKRLGMWQIPIGVILAGFFLFLHTFDNNLIMVYILSFLVPFCNINAMVACLTMIPRLLGRRASVGVGIFIGAYNLMNFVSSYVVRFIAGTFFEQTAKTRIMIGGIGGMIMGVGLLIVVIIATGSNRKAAQARANAA